MWWVLVVGLVSCSFLDDDRAQDDDQPSAEEAAEAALWTVSRTDEDWLLGVGEQADLVVGAPVTFLGPAAPDTEQRLVVGGAQVTVLWPGLAKVEVQRLAQGVNAGPQMAARPREPADAALLQALPEYGGQEGQQAVAALGSSGVKSSGIKSGGVKSSDIKATAVPAGFSEADVPIDLKTGSSGERYDALGRYESQEHMTSAIVWVMKNDSDFEVRRKAWRVIRARWRRGTGVAYEHEAAAVWLSSHGSTDLRREAIQAIGNRSSSLNNAKRHIGDGDNDIRLASAEAVAGVAERTDQGDQAREILSNQVAKEESKNVATQMGKLISSL